MFHLSFRKRIKGGVLLYVMVLAIIFGMLLQFYLGAQVATYKNLKSEENYQTAQIMIQLTQKKLAGKSGTVTFNKGSVTIAYAESPTSTVSETSTTKTSTSNGATDKITVQLSDGTKFTY